MGELELEKSHLKDTVDFITMEIEHKSITLEEEKIKVLEARKEMWDNGVHFTQDFDKLSDLNQSLMAMGACEMQYQSNQKQIEQYKRMLGTPYFGRFDFIQGGEDKDQIHVGIKNIIDDQSYYMWVYDWRAPICSVFYQYGLGKVSYEAPDGTIQGEITLKRQYKILAGDLKYYADCNTQINDEMLLHVLSQNTSSKMRNIVETIQKEQDAIIRDVENELVIVQGVAGSGKTSVALHRIAFLLYQGVNQSLTSNNMLILSPNDIFSEYISQVLPELGEENVCQITFDTVVDDLIGNRLKIESKMEFLDYRVQNETTSEFNTRKIGIAFKSSRDFKILLDRFISYYIKNYIPFQDVYYDGETITSKTLLKNQLLSNKIKVPLLKKLKRIRATIMKEIKRLEKIRLESIQNFVITRGGSEFHEKAMSRLLLYKRFQVLNGQIKAFTQVDYLEVYKTLFKDSDLWYRLSKGLSLPEEIEEIIKETYQNLEKDYITCEDASALLFIKLNLEGSDMFYDIKHVVIDEAQDYNYLEYEIFKMLFKESRFTIVGDVNQAIDEKRAELSWYKPIEQILDKKKSTRLFLNKGYRCSYGIGLFSQKILTTHEEHESLERESEEPVYYSKKSYEAIDEAIVKQIKNCQDRGYESIAILCKCSRETDKAYESIIRLSSKIGIKKVENTGTIGTGVVILPIYLAKGLEFDAVIIYNGSDEIYFTELDRKLLYIASTRALHQLTMYYTGDRSRYLPEGYEGKIDIKISS